MAGGEAEIIHEFLHEVNPPNRTQLYDRSTSASFPEAKNEEDRARAARVEMVIRWAAYGTQVAVSTALFHPFSSARVLMELGYEPLPPYSSRTLFGKPCFVLPSISAYVRFMKKRNGPSSLWRGFGANFWGVFVGNLANDLSYHVIDEFIKRKVRASPRKAWSVFVMANQENTRYSPTDFLEDLSKEVLARAAGLTLSYPFQVVFLRVAAQFVWQEKVYTSLSDSFLQIYRQAGFKGFYVGYLPYMASEIGVLILVWMASYAFRTTVTGDRIWLTIFRFASDYILRTMLYPFKLVGRLMAISASPLKVASPPFLPKFPTWRSCYEYLKAQNALMRGNSIFMRVVSPDQAAKWQATGLTTAAGNGSPAPVMSSIASADATSRFSNTDSSQTTRRNFPLTTFRTLF